MQIKWEIERYSIPDLLPQTKNMLSLAYPGWKPRWVLLVVTVVCCFFLHTVASRGEIGERFDKSALLSINTSG